MTAPGDGVKFLLIFLYAAWVLAFGYSFFAFATTAPDGSGFARGLNRVTAFLGWQGVAGVISMAVFAVSLQWPKGSAARHMAKVPIGLAVLLVLCIVGILVWGNVG